MMKYLCATCTRLKAQCKVAPMDLWNFNPSPVPRVPIKPEGKIVVSTDSQDLCLTLQEAAKIYPMLKSMRKYFKEFLK